jgi:uncharacterized protein (DUF1015 family)
MAEIRPLRAWRYNFELSKNIDALTSPLFDVVTENQLRALYKNPHNSIHLSVPEGPDAAHNAAALLDNWKAKKIIEQDDAPGIYVYYQYFTLAGTTKELCRKGFICNIRIYDWHENVILRHENTIPKSVNDRIDLLEKTELNVSATHGLYTDGNFTLEKFMDNAMTTPLYETEDYQGVRDVMAVIRDKQVIQEFINTLSDKKIILADGHHRYEGSLVYRNKRCTENPRHTGDEGYNFHLMYLTNTEAGDLRILPTHRLIHDIKNFDEASFIKRLEDDFTVKPIEDPGLLNEIILGKQWAFGVLLKNNALKIRLKPEASEKLKWPFPEVVRKLDLTVMHYFIIEKILGIPGKQQRSAEEIGFERNFSECLRKVIKEEVQMALITNEVSIEEVKRVCESGYTMPQKSTYFYPKVICGFLFSSIIEEEFV